MVAEVGSEQTGATAGSGQPLKLVAWAAKLDGAGSRSLEHGVRGGARQRPDGRRPG